MVPIERLSQLRFFQGLPAWVMRRFAEAACETSLASGQYIVRQHDEGTALFFLLSGSVEFLIRFEGVDDLLVGTSREVGAMIGWSVFRIPHRYTASVRCEHTCHCLRLPADALAGVIAEDPRLGYLLLRRVSAVLANRLEQARDLLTGSSGNRGDMIHGRS